MNEYQILNNVTVQETFYPGVVLNVDGKLFIPKERIMSLSNMEDIQTQLPIRYGKNKCKGYYFYFLYNTDNYYHFVYDTLPHIMRFFLIREEYPSTKLLMNFPNTEKKEFYNFVIEFLKLYNITSKDIELVDSDTEYETLFISNPFDMNKPNPIVNRMSYTLSRFYRDYKDYPKKIYISRRSHLHNNHANMGTNYTSRRKMINEDDLVKFLISKGYTEIFTENLSVVENIQLFSIATHIIGPIGGGMCNALFSKQITCVIPIISPTFLDVNSRFLFSMNRCRLYPFSDTEHIENTDFKTNMRVVTKDGIIGEISSINENRLNLRYSKEKIAGWNNSVKYLTTTVPMSDCKKLDNGLNSPYRINLDSFKEHYDSVCGV